MLICWTEKMERNSNPSIINDLLEFEQCDYFLTELEFHCEYNTSNNAFKTLYIMGDNPGCHINLPCNITVIDC